MQNPNSLLEELSRLQRVQHQHQHQQTQTQQQPQTHYQQQQQQQLPQQPLQVGPTSLSGLVNSGGGTKYPLASALLGTLLPSLAGPAPGLGTGLVPAPAPNPSADALLLLQRLQGGGGMQQQQQQQQLTNLMGGNPPSSAPAPPPPPPPAPVAAPAPIGLQLGNPVEPNLASMINSASITQPTTPNPNGGAVNDDLLRRLAASGLLGVSIQNLVNQQQQQNQPPVPAPPPAPPIQPTPASASIGTLLNSLISADQDRKREAAIAAAANHQTAAQQQPNNLQGPTVRLPKRQRLDTLPPTTTTYNSTVAAEMELNTYAPAPAVVGTAAAALPRHHQQVGSNGVDVLASAAARAAMDLKLPSQPSPATVTTESSSSKSIPKSDEGSGRSSSLVGGVDNYFPLPPADENDTSRNGYMGMPKLTSFRKAWDNVKTTSMQKEIFLRKLHAGKIVQQKQSRSAPAGQVGGGGGGNQIMTIGGEGRGGEVATITNTRKAPPSASKKRSKKGRLTSRNYSA